MPVQPVLYEAMYILDAKLDEEGIQTAVQTLEDFITSNGGEVIATREFGKRRLAYEIEGHTSGTYMILYFKSFGPLVAEVQHEMRLLDAVVRGIICVANPKAIFDPKPEVVEEEAGEGEEAVAEGEEAPADADEAVAEAEEAPVEVEEVVAEVEEAPAEAEEAVAEEAPAEEAVAEVEAEPVVAEEPAVEEEAAVAEADAPATEEEA